MDLQRLQTVLDTRYRNDPEDRRALKVLRKVRKTLDKRVRAQRRNDPDNDQASNHARNLLRTLTEAFDSGKRIVAMDAEWSRDGSRPITEIGLAIYENGNLTLRNIRVLPDYLPSKDKFLGTTEFMEPEQAKAVYAEIEASADLLCGHALRNDRVQFQRWKGVRVREDRVFDTQVYGKSAFRTILSLRDLMRRLDITPTGVHSAGNDAYYVMMAMLALAGRLDECRAFGAKPVDPKADARMEAVRKQAKERNKSTRDDRTPEERERAQMPSLAPSEIRVGITYAGRQTDDWPRRVERIEEVDQPRAPSGKQTVVHYRKIGSDKEKSITLTNFAHWAVEIREAS